MIFVDTNYFLRFLLKEKNQQQQKTIELFKKASFGKVKLFTSTIVIFEIYWVLFSFYKKNKKEIKSVLLDIFKMDFIQIAEKGILETAIRRIEEFNYDLEDAYNFVYATKNKAEEFLTFDKTLSKKFCA